MPELKIYTDVDKLDQWTGGFLSMWPACPFFVVAVICVFPGRKSALGCETGRLVNPSPIRAHRIPLHAALLACRLLPIVWLEILASVATPGHRKATKQ